MNARYYMSPHTGRVYQANDVAWMSAATLASFLPVVVIDPEDREQVERLTVALHERTTPVGNFGPDGYSADEVANALREFANPTPPKPDEPTGRYAVVEDAAGERWIKVYTFDDGDDRTWAVHGCVGSISTWRAYAEIDAVRVLSEGVQS